MSTQLPKLRQPGERVFSKSQPRLQLVKSTVERKLMSDFRDLKRQGFPQGEYRILCHNCNQSYGYHGYCPHQRNENENHSFG